MDVLPITWKSGSPVASATVDIARRHGMSALVIATSFAVSIGLWQSYLPHWKQLWTDVVHDRNAHLEAGLGLASDLIHFRPSDAIRDVDRFRTWPPLHDGILVGGSLMLSGLDVRAAVWPSLLGFAASAILAYFLTRRLCDSQLAGLFAAMMVLVSPAQRAFATDVMLESLGAALTLAALLAAVRLSQDYSPFNWRWLAIALSGLFFLKYNYWLLVVIALTLSQWSALLRLAFAINWKRLPKQLRNPLNWVIALLVLGCLLIKFGLWAKWAPLSNLTARSTMGLATAAYWLFLLRLAPWYLRFRRESVPGDAGLRMLVNWHLLPVALWLAWPQKLACFLWVLNPGDNVGEFPADDRFGGFWFYADAIASDYHAWSWSAVVVGLLVAAGVVTTVCGPRRPGAGIVVLFFVIAATLTATHPNRKSRFLHSWLPSMWVLAGVGIYSIGTNRGKTLQPAVSLACLGLIAVHLPALAKSPHAPESGVQSDRPSALELSDSYLPDLANAQRPAIVSNVPLKFLARWTFMNQYGRGVRPLTEIPDFDARRICPENETAFGHWIASTKCDAIVWIQLPTDSPWYVPVPGCAGLEQFGRLLKQQRVFGFSTPSARIDGALIEIWRRK